MELNARIETAESVKEKAKAALGLDLSSALDLVKRSDYDRAMRRIWTLVLVPRWSAAAPNIEPPEAA